MLKLRELHIQGFKSIDGEHGATIPFGDVTVLLGANGAGKSNLVSFFKMLNFMISGALSQYVGQQGASRLLFYGPKKTESLSFELQFEDDNAVDTYSASLSYGLPDRLFFAQEEINFQRRDALSPHHVSLQANDMESGLKSSPNKTSKVVYALLSGICTYQFHDTSDTAKIKDRGYVDDARYLRHNAGNLAAFLKMLKEHESYTKYYDRIVRHIRRIMPQFGDFDLQPVPGNKDYVRLNWKDSSGSDYLFDPHQISDGSLRFMALATLLLQPPELLPRFIVLDEPELGLHPAAIAELAAMVNIAAQKTQVLLATQSPRLVDEFSADQVVIVERDETWNSSIFKKLDSEELADWLTRYSLSELWEKNVLGGQP